MVDIIAFVLIKGAAVVDTVFCVEDTVLVVVDMVCRGDHSGN